MEQKWGIFVVKRLHISNIFGLPLDLGFSFEKSFGLWLDLD